MIDGIDSGERFRTVGLLAQGGFGWVDLVDDLERGDQCCIKHVPREHEAVVQRALAEVSVLMTIDSPHVVPVRAYGITDTTLWYAMDRMQGSLLDKVAPGTQSDPVRVTRWMVHALAGLEVLHRRGIVHRDVKPANLLFDEASVVKVADLGLAKHPAGSVRCRTKTGSGLGTPSFAAPELLRDAHHADHRADLFGVGATFFSLTTGVKASRFVLHAVEASVFDAIPDAFVPALTALGAPQADKRPDSAREAAAMLCAAADTYAREQNRAAHGDAWMRGFDAAAPPLGLSKWIASRLWHLGLR